MLHPVRLMLLGLHFVVAGCINLCIVLVRPFNPDNTRLCGRVYSLPALRILGLSATLQVDSLVSQPNPFVLVVNHQSNFDLFVLGSVVPRRTVTIGKTSLKWIPFFGQVYWLAGNVLINRGNAQKAKRAMLQTTDVLQHHDTSIWVFPEGTRNLGRGLLPFKKGAFQMAIAAGVPIVPMCCSNYKNVMRLNRWHAGEVRICALAPIATAGMTLEDMPVLMRLCQEQMAQCVAELDRKVQSASAQF
jgi:1-acyl-sn-glycerol-3-phosphate acyltransferase